MGEAGKILCKIAEKDIDLREDSLDFLNEKWKILPFMPPNTLEHLIQFPKGAVFQWTKTTVDNKTYLAIQFNTKRSFKGYENIFELILKNYQPEISINDTSLYETLEDTDKDAKGETKLLKKYLTKSLFNALDFCHNTSTKIQKDLEITLDLPANFQPKLRPYQEKTVRWLLKRERVHQPIPSFFSALETIDGSCIVYVHKYCSFLQLERPPDIVIPPGGILADEMGLGKTVEALALILLNPRDICSEIPNYSRRPNDEEPAEKRWRPAKQIFCTCGYNKDKDTIECQGCFRWQHIKCMKSFLEENQRENYICPECWSSFTHENPLEIGATLIVAPHSIRTQWWTEIRRHISPPPRVLIFEGTVGRKWISPKQLANYDIVLTDYNVLRREIYHTKENESKFVRRNAPRFMRMVTPLLMVQWWRVCIDEAQVVESNASKIAMMVRQLPAINRWGVTGTPIQRSIDDLQPLLKFIGFDEVCEPKDVWSNLVHDYMLHHDDIWKSKHPLVGILQLCMWRTSKENVFAELEIPPQTHVVHRIDLSDLEKLYYNEEHEKCRGRFNGTVAKYIARTDCKTVTISPHIMKLILFPLLKMRQCCTIPVLVNEKQGRQYMQPKELLPYMKSNNELECKSELRTMASSYNGKACAHVIRGELNAAIKNYQQVLKLATDYKQFNLGVDSLLQIHALYNIQKVCMEFKNLKQTMPLSEEKLAEYKDNCNALEWKYLQTYASSLNTTQLAYKEALKLQRESTNDLDGNIIDYLADLSVIITKNHEQLEQPLLNKIIEDCLVPFGNNAALAELRSMASLLYFLKVWHTKVENLMRRILKELDALQYFIDNVRPFDQVDATIKRTMMEFVQSVYHCHLSEIRNNQKKEDEEETEQEDAKLSFGWPNRSTRSKKENLSKKSKKENLCKLCSISSLLDKLECLLFNKTINKKSDDVEGDQNPSLEFYLVKVVLLFMRSKERGHLLLKNVDKYIDLLNYLPDISKKLIKFWIELEYMVKAYDELDMCKMRMKIGDDTDSKFNLKPDEVNHFAYEQEINLRESQEMFVRLLARLKYINHLQSEIELFCPICLSKDESKYVMLQCGHVFCVACFNSAKRIEFPGRNLVKCYTCRTEEETSTRYYLTGTTENSIRDKSGISAYSSKIMYIVQTVVNLKNEHNDNDTSTPKILIFSQWQPILLAIANALKEYGVTFRHKFSPKAVDEFKNAELGVTCLLLLISNGAKGLNLTEATHVFLVEPLLNPGEELQAIGRVHRFGQTKPTTVHRFIVNNTIEDNIYRVVSENSESQANWEFNNLTVESIKNLFVLRTDVEDEEVNQENQEIT